MTIEAPKNHAGLIWSIADLLQGDYRRSDYGRLLEQACHDDSPDQGRRAERGQDRRTMEHERSPNDPQLRQPQTEHEGSQLVNSVDGTRPSGMSVVTHVKKSSRRFASVASGVSGAPARVSLVGWK